MKGSLRPRLGSAMFLGLWPLLGGVTCNNTCSVPAPDSYPALCVLVVDAETGEPIPDAVVQASDGITTETLPQGIDDPLAYYAVERGGYVRSLGYCGVSKPGTYMVTVQTEGYRTAQVTEVRMLENCPEEVPVLPVDLLVELSRDESP